MSTHNPLDTTNAEAQAAAARAINRAKTAKADLAWLMSDKRGRRICSRLLDDAGVYRTSFSTNAMTMAFNEGARNAGTKLLASINEACPEQYLTLLKEFNE